MNRLLVVVTSILVSTVFSRNSVSAEDVNVEDAKEPRFIAGGIALSFSLNKRNCEEA
jgi:hypothetical protein